MLLKDKRIFIVEDNIANRAIIQLLLEQHGAKTAIDRWGTEAIKRLQAFSPVDVILLDLMLGESTTGYDIFDAIRQMPEFDPVPIVAVSATDPSAAIPLTRQKGFSGFLMKPISFDLFPRQIVSILNGEKVWQSR